MNFVADLHIHSRFSRATSRALTLPHLAGWAGAKGIDVLGTGDFTHPAWRQELRDNLLFDEQSGLYRLKGKAENPIASSGAGREPYFCLQAEISSIYKAGGATRKIHNLVFVPDLDAADRLSARLALVGNISSDGRPILGLPARDLLEMVLESSPGAVMVPAHIWTPWFSLFGSRSGYDRLEDCFGDLSGHIFALETGLSSDPAMNRHWSALDEYTLISNSDAHSGANLGREANLFSGEPSYDGMFDALRLAGGRKPITESGCRFLGTMEFFPEEGKYHLDGHRACGVSLEPAEAAARGNICPVCGKPLTIGVLHRVMELADRKLPELAGQPEARMLVPLSEIVGEILGAGSATQKAKRRYAEIINRFGSELAVLCALPPDEIGAFWPPLGEAVDRMRQGRALVSAGYDGQYGRIKLFAPGELEAERALLPSLQKKVSEKSSGRQNRGNANAFSLASETDGKGRSAGATAGCSGAGEYSPPQKEALEAGPGPVFVIAGPGAGKTRLLVGRMEKLLRDGRKVLAITYTRRAAEEMRQRLSSRGFNSADCDTLHAIAHRLLCAEKTVSLLQDAAASSLFARANHDIPARERQKLWEEICRARETLSGHGAEAGKAYARYAEIKHKASPELVDYGDLLDWLLEAAPAFRGRWEHILVDEIQDFSPLQMEITRRLLPTDGDGFFGIGDPDQAIYGFRGASGQSAESLSAIWPGIRVCRLSRSYRSSQKVLDAAQSVLRGECGNLYAELPLSARLHLFSAPDAEKEAGWVARTIEALLGGGSHSMQDVRNELMDGELSPGEIGVLVRLKAQLPPLVRALEKAGVSASYPAEEEFWLDGQCQDFMRLAADWHGLSYVCAEVKTFFAWRQKPPDFKSGLEPGKLLDLAAPEGSELEVGLLLDSPAFKSLCRMWRRCGGWEGFFAELPWLCEAELLKNRAQQVQLMTLHASKGLEFQAVFMPGLENGLLPFNPAHLFGGEGAGAWRGDLPDEAEERRLCYVGLTRSARGLFLSHALKRRLFGLELKLEASPFLAPLAGLFRKTRLEMRPVARKLSLFG